MSTPIILAKLALAALDRGEVESAKEILGVVVLLPQVAPVATASSAACAVSIKDAATALGFCAKHVRKLADRGEIPSIGKGRGRRILINEAIAKLRDANVDDAEQSGRRYAARRNRLRIVDGGGE
jgi:hypothetical protein